MQDDTTTCSNCQLSYEPEMTKVEDTVVTFTHNCPHCGYKNIAVGVEMEEDVKGFKRLVSLFRAFSEFYAYVRNDTEFLESVYWAFRLTKTLLRK